MLLGGKKCIKKLLLKYWKKILIKICYLEEESVIIKMIDITLKENAVNNKKYPIKNISIIKKLTKSGWNSEHWTVL